MNAGSLRVAPASRTQAFDAAIGEDDVHVWCVASAHPLPAVELERMRDCLLPHERERESSFRFARDRQTYVLTRALVRSALSACTGIAPRELRLHANAHGKPELVGISDAERVSFNVSHTEGLIALAVQRSGRIGIDVEKVCVRSASLDIAERFFAATEVAGLREAAASELPSGFFRYWTLKESYVKARGVGLSVPLDEFAFHLDASPGAIGLRPAPGDDASTWKVWQLAGEAHLMAICAEHAPDRQPRLHVRALDGAWQDTGTALDLIGES